MASLNNWQIIGNLARDAEMRYTTTGVPQLKFGVAMNYKSKDKEETEWANCVWFGERGAKIATYLVKGCSVYVTGRHVTNKWTGDDGVKHEKVELLVNDVVLLGSRQQGATWSGQNEIPNPHVTSLSQKAAALWPQEKNPLDDLPFD